MKTIKYIFLIILITFGNKVYSQNDSITFFTKKTFKITIVSEMLNDSLAIMTKPYLKKLYLKIKIQESIINKYSETDKYISELNNYIKNLQSEIQKLEELLKIKEESLLNTYNLYEAEKKSVTFEKEKTNKLLVLYEKTKKNYKTLKIISYSLIPVIIIVGIII